MFLLVAEACQAFMGLTKHMLLENDGKETLQTILKRVAFKLNGRNLLMQCGKILIMIQKDLIVVGDWMAPKYLK
jgi:hypothetical protein